MSKPEPATPYERFVEATRTILSVSKKDVEKDMLALRKKRARKQRKRRPD